MSRVALALVALVLLTAVASAQPHERSATLVEKPPATPAPPQGPLAIQPTFYADGRTVAFEGVPTEFHVVVQNPLAERANGTIRLAPVGDATLNVTSLDYDLAPGAFDAWGILLTARGGAVAITASAPALDGATTRLDLDVAAPLSVAVSSPTASHLMGAQEEVRFRANVTNHGPTPRGDALAVFVRDEAVAERVLDPPLAPGETREIDWGLVRPSIPHVERDGRPFSFPAPWTIAMRTDDGLASAFLLIVDANGTVDQARLARGDMHVVVGASVRLELDRAAPGERSVVVARVRNDGEGPLDATLRIDARSTALRFNPAWRLDPFEKRVLLMPGETGEFPYVFTPRVAASLHMEASLSNASFYLSDSLRIDMESLVELVPDDEPWTKRSNLSDEGAWRLRLTAREDVDRARLHVAVAPRYGQSYDGLVAQHDLLELDVASSEPLDGMRAGEERDVVVRYTGRASGSFVIVPFVEIDGVAHLGALPATYFASEDGRPPTERLHDAAYEAQELRSVVLVANVMPTPLAPIAAVAPAALLFLGVVGLWAGRRFLVR